MKYCCTVKPSRKFAVMGASIISPEGFAIKPRIPANCRICCFEPRAPESTINRIGFNPWLAFSARSISLNIMSEIFSVTSHQRPTTLFQRSPSVIAPPMSYRSADRYIAGEWLTAFQPHRNPMASALRQSMQRFDLHLSCPVLDGSDSKPQEPYPVLAQRRVGRWPATRDSAWKASGQTPRFVLPATGGCEPPSDRHRNPH